MSETCPKCGAPRGTRMVNRPDTWHTIPRIHNPIDCEHATKIQTALTIYEHATKEALTTLGAHHD